MAQNPMDMNPQEIRVALLRAKITQAEIARRLNITNSAVGRVISGKSVSDRVRRAVAEAAGVDVRMIWPSTYIISGGPRKPGRPPAN